MAISQHLLMAYVDGELEDEELERIAAVLADDAELAREVEEQRRLRLVIDPYTSGEPLPAAWQSILSAGHAAPANGPDADRAAAAPPEPGPERRSAIRAGWLTGALAASIAIGATVGCLAP